MVFLSGHAALSRNCNICRFRESCPLAVRIVYSVPPSRKGLHLRCALGNRCTNVIEAHEQIGDLKPRVLPRATKSRHAVTRGDSFLRLVDSFRDYSGRSAVLVYAIEAGRSPFEFATPALSVLL
jgi:hypothetical protein